MRLHNVKPLDSAIVGIIPKATMFIKKVRYANRLRAVSLAAFITNILRIFSAATATTTTTDFNTYCFIK